MSENKTGKYFKYAIGEIILVVIGILIALQVNAWNQYNKDRLEERNILNRIEKDLKADLADLNIQINRNIVWQEELQFIIDGIIAKNMNLTDFVEKNRSYIANTYFEQMAGTYKESIASGKISLIINDSLRNKILKHYEVTEIGMDETIKNQMRDFIRPAFYKAFGSSKEFIENVSQKPINLESLDLNTVYKDKEYLTATALKLGLLKGQNGQFNGQIRRTEKILDAIKVELRKRWP